MSCLSPPPPRFMNTIDTIEKIIMTGKSKLIMPIVPLRRPGWVSIRPIIPRKAIPITTGKMIAALLRGTGRGAANGSATVSRPPIVGGTFTIPSRGFTVAMSRYRPCSAVIGAAGPASVSCMVIAARRDNSGPAGHTRSSGHGATRGATPLSPSARNVSSSNGTP